ncbi:hypothetical protein EDD11_004112 [Mortierella claussenii]|nr:hypothetical protein EDD11_004112 [Mortierella claussenii]
MANSHWTSKEIFEALSKHPLEIETSFSIDSRDTTATAVATDKSIQNKIILKDNDCKFITIDGNGTRASEISDSASLARLHLKSTVAFLPMATSISQQHRDQRCCVRTLEMSLDSSCPSFSSSSSEPSPTVPLTSSRQPLPQLQLQSFRASMSLPLSGKTIFANGYQSWSTSFAGADETSVFEQPNWFYNELTHLGLASDIHVYEYPGKKGRVHSNVVTMMRDKCLDLSDATMTLGGQRGMEYRPEEVVLCGSLSEDFGYTYFLMDVNQGTFTISQDCVGKQLQTADDKLVLRTFFVWDGKDTTVWDAYAAAWKAQHHDRRFIHSSLHHQLSGWTSWYCHYENINEHIILENLQHFTGHEASGSGSILGQGSEGQHLPLAQAIGSGWPAKVFQIDDGYTVVGDWLTCNREKFPRGMSFIAETIHDKGLIPGLWLAPFLASKKSNIVKDHPEWFVRKACAYKIQCQQEIAAGATTTDANMKQRRFRRQNHCCCCSSFSGSPDPSTELMLAHPAFQVGAFALDLENPEVQAHLANVFRVVTQEWGFKMLKLDFLFAAALVARNGKTRGQLMWESMQMVRDWVGPETILLGCGVPLGASFMVVDYCRVGCDVGASWDTMQRHFHDREYISCFNSLTSTLSRWAMSGRFFGNDPDVFFIRDWNMGLNAAERRTLMVLNHLLGHLVFCSDPFDTSRMSFEQQKILNSFFPWTSTPSTPLPAHEIVRVLQPLVTQKDVYFVQVEAPVGERKDEKSTFVVVANLSPWTQQVHLTTIEQILAREEQANSGNDISSSSEKSRPSIYLHAETGQFGSSAAVYTIRSRETCVFLRVVDSLGRMCGQIARTLPSGYGPTALKEMEEEETVYLMATTDGHVLPTTEVVAFGRHAKYQHQLTVKFRPCYFPKTVTVWLAWKTSSSEGETNKQANRKKATMTLNDQPLCLHPEMQISPGIILASCTLCLSP